MERPQFHSLALLTYEIQFLNSHCMLKYVAQEWSSSRGNSIVNEVGALAPELSGKRQPWYSWSQPLNGQASAYNVKQEQQEPINPNSFLHILLNYAQIDRSLSPLRPSLPSFPLSLTIICFWSSFPKVKIRITWTDGHRCHLFRQAGHFFFVWWF